MLLVVFLSIKFPLLLKNTTSIVIQTYFTSIRIFWKINYSIYYLLFGISVSGDWVFVAGHRMRRINVLDGKIENYGADRTGCEPLCNDSTKFKRNSLNITCEIIPSTKLKNEWKGDKTCKIS